MCSSCRVRAVPFAQASQYKYTIPIQEVSASNSRCKFKVFFCKSNEKVNAALTPYGIKITSIDKMGEFADYYDRGEAKAFYKVDFDKILTDIDFTEEENSKTECELVCTY